MREGDALERLAGVTKIMFDKTGTLTYGTPKVIAQKSLLPEWSDTELYALCAAVEQFSEHPFGKAIVQSYQQMHGAISQKAEQFQMWTGRGVSAQVSGVSVLEIKSCWKNSRFSFQKLHKPIYKLPCRRAVP